jgi:HK97 family phage prohead protease
MTDYERRAQTGSGVSADGLRKMRGYAIVFDSMSEDLGGFREIISPDAVDRTLKEALDVRALVNHDHGKVIGRTSAGTLELAKDKKGLRVLIEPDLEISYAADVMRSVSRGDISAMSFGFRVVEDDWNFDAPIAVRTVLDMKVSEVSIVAWPAYTATNIDAAVRSMQEAAPASYRPSLAMLQRIHRQRML